MVACYGYDLLRGGCSLLLLLLLVVIGVRVRVVVVHYGRVLSLECCSS